MEQLFFEYDTVQQIYSRSHVGVAGSGDLEILIEPLNNTRDTVTVQTSVKGNRDVWEFLLKRFFHQNNISAHIEINDFGATPGVVSLRLAQAVEALEEEQ